MTTVVVAESALVALDRLIATHGLPDTTRRRLQASIRGLSTFPLLGPALTGRWAAYRFLVGPWAWLLIVYLYDPTADRVTIVTFQDARSATAATAER